MKQISRPIQYESSQLVWDYNYPRGPIEDFHGTKWSNNIPVVFSLIRHRLLGYIYVNAPTCRKTTRELVFRSRSIYFCFSVLYDAFLGVDKCYLALTCITKGFKIGTEPNLHS